MSSTREKMNDFGINPLNLLREFTRSERKVTLEGDYLVFDNLRFPKGTLTNFYSQKGQKQPYTISACWFLLQHPSAKYTDYLSECKKFDIERISLVDKRDLLSYLTGETESCGSIKSTPPPGVFIPTIASTTSQAAIYTTSSLLDAPPIEKTKEKRDLQTLLSDSVVSSAVNSTIASSSPADLLSVSGERSPKRPKLLEDQEKRDQELRDKELLAHEKLMVAQRLDTPRVKTTSLSELEFAEASERVDGLSAEKIKELKIKRMVKKTSEIKETTGDNVVAPTKLRFVEADISITRDIVNQEYTLRNRASILQSTKKNFSSIIQAVTENLKQEEQKRRKLASETNNRSHHLQQRPPKTHSSHIPLVKKVSPQASNETNRLGAVNAMASYDRYQEVQEDRFWKEKLKENEPGEFQIDTRGTFAPNPKDSSEIGSVNNSSDNSITNSNKNNTSTTTSTSNYHHHHNNNNNNSSISHPSKPMTVPPHSLKQGHVYGSSLVSSANIGQRVLSARHSDTSANVSIAKRTNKHEIPIIIVPSAMTAMLTLYNVKEFLEEGTFMSSTEKRQSGAKKENKVYIQRKKQGIAVRYEVIDDGSKLSSNDWHRVVAVFVHGPLWQFRGWKFSNPVDLLSEVLGFYLYFEEDQIPTTVKDMDVKILIISKSKSKQHMVQTAMVKFWDAIDDFIRRRCINRFPAPFYVSN